MLGTYNRLDLHVSASWRDVVRAAVTKVMVPYRPAERRARRKIFRALVREHQKAGKLYRHVVTGG